MYRVGKYIVENDIIVDVGEIILKRKEEKKKKKKKKKTCICVFTNVLHVDLHFFNIFLKILKSN